MYIEIKGISFINKGSELMLYAILQKVSQKIPQAKFVLAPGTERPFEKRNRLGLYQKIDFFKFGKPLGMYFGKYIPRQIRIDFGLVYHEEIRIVFDASGYLYTDKWGPRSTVLMAKAINQWKKNDTKVILLPQAIGPLNSKKIRKALTYVLENADLVFPRDDVSYKYVNDLVGNQKHIIQAPDFTNLVKGVVPEEFKGHEDRFCIIPNYRMIDKTSSEINKKYLPFIVNCIKNFLKYKIRPFMLIHEGENDLWLARKISKQFKDELEIISESDPLKIKGIIGSCRGVISCRYHGLASALSQGVPCLATSWSHKYETLFTEYNFPEGCIPVNASVSEIEDRMVNILNKSRADSLRQKLIEAAKVQKKGAENMWAKVFECIRGTADI